MIDQALLGRVEKQSWFHKYPRGWPFLLFLIASIGTAVSVIAIERADRQTRRVELERNVTEISSALQRRVTENIALLRAGAALFSMRADVQPADFHEFAGDLQASGSLYGSLGLGWAPLVPVDQLGSFEAGLVGEGLELPLVHPRPMPQQIYSTPILFLEPRTPENVSALGYDMYSEATRRAAMNLAMKLGKPVASGKVRLVQDRAAVATAGFLIYMPVIVNRDGRSVVRGFVYSPFRAEEFVESAAQLYRNEDLHVAIYDAHVDPANLLAERRTEAVGGTTIDRRIDVGNHTWVIQVSDAGSGMLSSLSRLTLFFGAMTSLLVMAIGRLITRRAAEDRRVLEWLTSQNAIRNSLTRELNHRVKNTLANVLSIAALTRRRSKGIDDFTDSLTARIRALSATHDLLSQSDWSNAPLSDVVRSELAPYMEGSEGHVDLAGPDIKLAPNDAMSLGLAIHELATNAAKYGALSTPEGRIVVRWNLLRPDLAAIEWREEGGPPVTEPTKRGFGRDLIEKIVAHELKSEVELRFEPAGVQCRLMVPIRLNREFSLRPRGGI